MQPRDQAWLLLHLAFNVVAVLQLVTTLFGDGIMLKFDLLAMPLDLGFQRGGFDSQEVGPQCRQLLQLNVYSSLVLCWILYLRCGLLMLHELGNGLAICSAVHSEVDLNFFSLLEQCYGARV